MLEVAVVFEEAQSSITPFVWPDTDSVKHTFIREMKLLTPAEIIVCSQRLILLARQTMMVYMQMII